MASGVLYCCLLSSAVQAPGLVYCHNIFIRLTSVRFLSVPLQVMKVNACGCYSLSVSFVQLTQFEDWEGASGTIITYHKYQPPNHCIPQLLTPNSSYTTSPNPQIIAYHNSQPPNHRMPQLPTPTSLHITPSTPQFIP